jgi:hypothetical protein
MFTTRSTSRHGPIDFRPAWFAEGALAQLGERLVCNQEVIGSIPIRSIDLRNAGQCEGQFPAPARSRI